MQDRTRSKSETAINPSAVAEEDQEQSMRSDHGVQCVEYPRSLAVRFFMLIENR